MTTLDTCVTQPLKQDISESYLVSPAAKGAAALELFWPCQDVADAEHGGHSGGISLSPRHNPRSGGGKHLRGGSPCPACRAIMWLPGIPASPEQGRGWAHPACEEPACAPSGH